MRETFYGANAFNKPLAWDTSKVTNMESIMQIARAFSQPLVWDTSKVVTMQNTFVDAKAFNSGQQLFDLRELPTSRGGGGRERGMKVTFKRILICYIYRAPCLSF